MVPSLQPLPKGTCPLPPPSPTFPADLGAVSLAFHLLH